MNVNAKKIEPPKPETKVVITLDMTLEEAVALYYALGKQPFNAPLVSEVRNAMRREGISV